MESLSHVIRVSLPKYLAALPVPESVTGFFHLSLGDWLSLTPLGLLVAGTTYLSYRALTSAPPPPTQKSSPKKKNKVNESVKKDNPKVVDTFDIEEVGEKKAFCRCWRSAKFPFCDGSHAKHNEETGDNVGPLIIKK